jgi:hypothetical protein
MGGLTQIGHVRSAEAVGVNDAVLDSERSARAVKSLTANDRAKTESAEEEREGGHV